MNIRYLITVVPKLMLSYKERNLYLAGLGFFDLMSDEKYLKKMFAIFMNQELDLTNPVTFNQKLQWLKLNDRNTLYTTYVDKYKVREYIKNILGEQYLIPLLGVWDSPEQIDFNKLPDKFVLKCNHNSGCGMCICKDKEKIDVQNIIYNLNKGMKENYYLTGREWPYKNVERKIIAEQYMETEDDDLPDYKIHCFNGEPRFILVCRDRFKKSGLTEDFYTEKWEHLPVKREKHPNSINKIEKPEKLDEMLELAKKLAQNIPFVRIDFYIIHERIYFGEMTFFPASGFEKFIPEKWDYTFGEWLTLPKRRQGND